MVQSGPRSNGHISQSDESRKSEPEDCFWRASPSVANTMSNTDPIELQSTSHQVPRSEEHGDESSNVGISRISEDRNPRVPDSDTRKSAVSAF
jgi:hypothetical protein